MLTRHKRLRISTNLSKLIRLSVHTILIALLLISSLPVSRSDRLYYLMHGHHEDHDYHLDSDNENRVETEAQCKRYLCKYGYLNCNCTNYLLLQHQRHKRAFAPPIPTELEHHGSYQPDHPVTFPPKLTTSSNQACNHAHFIRAYEEFQTIYRLNVTGHCDRVTKSFMSRSRCGQPDIFDQEEQGEGDDNKLGNGRKNPYISASSSQEKDYSSEEDGGWKREKRSAASLEELVHVESSIRKRQLEELITKEEVDNQDTYNNGRSTRKKRSFHFQISDPIGKLNKEVITWRLMSAHINPTIPVTTQNAILTQAFRYWSEVAPICFRQDKRAPRVDIEVGFLEGTHLNCYKQFDGRGGEVAHKFFRDVHFDKTDPYTASANPPRPTDISLLLVAVHEIGHVLGLNHSVARDSVMNAIYHRNIRGRFELSTHDRLEIKNMYGPCSGRFDVVMDYVRNSGNSRVFNTYLFRGDDFWMYENKNRRTRYGDPKKISPDWTGLPANLDAYVHYFESDRGAHSRITDRYYFFKGSTYYRYDSTMERVTHTGLIRTLFARGPHGAVPNNLDAAFFEHNSRKIFFFKGDSIYKYNYRLTGTHSCCLHRPSKIVDVFRPATSADLYAPNTRISYATNLDAVYLSWSAPYNLYLIKGEHAWKVDGYAIRGPYNEANLRVRYVGKWNTIWNYVCETDCPG